MQHRREIRTSGWYQGHMPPTAAGGDLLVAELEDLRRGVETAPALLEPRHYLYPAIDPPAFRRAVEDFVEHAAETD